jgi:hypothetical protein
MLFDLCLDLHVFLYVVVCLSSCVMPTVRALLWVLMLVHTIIFVSLYCSAAQIVNACSRMYVLLDNVKFPQHEIELFCNSMQAMGQQRHWCGELHHKHAQIVVKTVLKQTQSNLLLLLHKQRYPFSIPQNLLPLLVKNICMIAHEFGLQVVFREVQRV